MKRTTICRVLCVVLLALVTAFCVGTLHQPALSASAPESAGAAAGEKTAEKETTGEKTAPENTEPKYIAFTFDDGPSPYTEQLLDGLKERRVTVSFFMLGENVEKYPATALRVYREGNSIGCHSMSHRNYSKMKDKAIKADIKAFNEQMHALKLPSAKMIRPPYGAYKKNFPKQCGAAVVLWNIDPEDWRDRDAETVRERIVSAAKPNAIVLLHDIYESSVEGALLAIDDLKKEGYTVVPADWLLKHNGKFEKGAVLYRG